MMACNDAIDRLEDTLNEIIPDNPNKPYDVLEVIRAIVDNRDFFECQKLFAQNIVTGFARFNGQRRRHHREPTQIHGRRARH